MKQYSDKEFRYSDPAVKNVKNMDCGNGRSDLQGIRGTA